MGYRTLNLQTIHIDGQDLQRGIIEMWHELDSDYSPDNFHEDTGVVREDTEALGYKSEAERLVKEEWIEDEDDLSLIHFFLDSIRVCHGSYSTQFKYSVTPTVSGDYVVAVAFLT